MALEPQYVLPRNRRRKVVSIGGRHLGTWTLAQLSSLAAPGEIAGIEKLLYGIDTELGFVKKLAVGSTRDSDQRPRSRNRINHRVVACFAHRVELASHHKGRHVDIGIAL